MCSHTTAEAMARGFVHGGVTSFDRITASNSGNKVRATLWKNLGVDVCSNNAEGLRKSDVVFLAVKPHILPGVGLLLRVVASLPARGSS